MHVKFRIFTYIKFKFTYESNFTHEIIQYVKWEHFTCDMFQGIFTICEIVCEIFLRVQ
jgi:hypothetical protein